MSLLQQEQPRALPHSVPEVVGAPGRGFAGRRWLVFGVAVTLGVALLAVTQGSVRVPVDVMLRMLLTRVPGFDIPSDWPATFETIVWQIRLPRVLLAGVVGAVLAISGATYQGLFRNPLADPYLIGVASGAGLGATIAIVSPLNASFYGFSVLPVMAFLGALAAVGAAYSLARVGKTVPVTTLILAGVAIAALASSATSFLLMSSAENIRLIFSWLLGGFSVSNWSQLGIVLPYILPSIAVMLAYGRILNVFQLDEEQAAQLGVRVEQTKLLLIVAASLATAAGVAVSGLIGFVGLIVPHTIRLLWGPDYRFLLPMSLALGAAFLILADLLSRTLLGQVELPVGVVTAFFGAPFFLWVLRRRKRMVF